MTKFFATVRFVLLLPLLCAGLTGCLASEQQLRSRAATELACNKEPEVEEVDETTRTISACNRRITYVNTCEAGSTWRKECTWVQKGPMLHVASMVFSFDAPAGIGDDEGRSASAQADRTTESSGGGGAGDDTGDDDE